MLTGEQIRAARAALGESQSAFADRFGVDQATVCRWEVNGPPTRGTARKAIERMLSELLTGEHGGEVLPQGEHS